MPANWVKFTKDLSEYLSSKKEKSSKETADKIIDLYLEALNNKAQPLPGTSFFNSNDPKVISGKAALKESFAKAMDIMLKDPEQQNATFDKKKKDKNFVDPENLENLQKIPDSPQSQPIEFPPVDEKYYDEIISNSRVTFFIKQKDGKKSDKIFDYKTKVDLSAFNGYGIPLSIFGETISEVASTLGKYGKLPGLLKLITYTNPGFDLIPDINKKGVSTTHGELIKYFIDLYAKGGPYRIIGDVYRSATGYTEENLTPAIEKELSVLITLYSGEELKKWLEVASPYIEKTAKDKSIEEIKNSEGIKEGENVEGSETVLNKTIEEVSSLLSISPEKDPYTIMANSLVLFWSIIGISSPTLFVGPSGVPPSILPVPGIYQIIFPGIPFTVAKGLKVAFNVGANPKFTPEISFEEFQKNSDLAMKKIEGIGKLSSKATAAAIASVFATHLLSIKFIYFGSVPAAPSPIPSPAFVYSIY
jgi:hypothetical protein